MVMQIYSDWTLNINTEHTKKPKNKTKTKTKSLNTRDDVWRQLTTLSAGCFAGETLTVIIANKNQIINIGVVVVFF